MNEELELLLCAISIGIGATFISDLWVFFRKRLFGTPALNYAMVGRWFGHLARGRFAHASIAQAAPVRAELALGWIVHYLIGIVFAALLLMIWGLEWARQPTLLPALIVGITTIVAPFFIMQPAMGMGIAASRQPNPNAARLRSLVFHAVFGLGLYGSAIVWSLLTRP